MSTQALTVTIPASLAQELDPANQQCLASY